MIKKNISRLGNRSIPAKSARGFAGSGSRVDAGLLRKSVENFAKLAVKITEHFADHRDGRRISPVTRQLADRRDAIVESQLLFTQQFRFKRIVAVRQIETISHC